jgi:RNA polymerase sigma-70 factor (ECF subfamily)
VAVLKAMNARRKLEAAKRANLRPSASDVDALAADRAGPDSQLSLRSASDAVRSLLATLPEPQAETLALHCVLGYTIPEIASSTGAPRETVRSRLKEARRALREKMRTDPMLKEIIEEVP